MVLSAATPARADDPFASALRAADDAVVAILAFHGPHDRPMAWPVTPYRDAAKIVVTSTLAFMKKTQHVRRDGRVAMLVGGWQVTGRARVHADISGDEFVARFLPAEERKFPPLHEIRRVPFHRYLFWWYFGRVFIEFEPLVARPCIGDDHATLVTLDGDGFPVIVPIAAPAMNETSWPVVALDAGATLADNASATVLQHVEPTMDDLRQLVRRGRLRAGRFIERSRSGSLDPPPPRGWIGELKRQLEFHRQGREAKRIIAGWDGRE